MNSQRRPGRAALITKWTTQEGTAYVDAMVDVLGQRPPERLPFVDYLFLRVAVAASGVGRFISMKAMGDAWSGWQRHVGRGHAVTTLRLISLGSSWLPDSPR